MRFCLLNKYREISLNIGGNEDMDRYVVFIPVRGGSKSIPLKNIKIINGRPLVYWVLDAAVQCKKIDRVYLCTDSIQIREKVQEYISVHQCGEKLFCIDRPAETATDTASTESAMLYFANNYSNFEHIILVQATSPLLTDEHLTQAIEQYEHGNYDSMLSVVRQKRFCWRLGNNGYEPINYDYLKRPRRQEFDGYLVENGAFYINTLERLLKNNCRLSGKVGVYEMPEETYFEIDEPSDWIVIEHLLHKKNAAKTKVQEQVKKIKMLLTDCDGVLTDGGMYYSENGDEAKRFNTKDGMAAAKLREHGIKFGIITGENIQLVRRRAEKLQADVCYIGIKDKLSVINEICDKFHLSYEEIAYIGDDINDVDVLKVVCLPCSVENGTQSAKQEAMYITHTKGGDGAVREVAEMILKYKNCL